MKRVLFIVFGAAAALAPLSVFAGEIQVPCAAQDQKASGYKRSCDSLLNGPNGLLALIDQQVKTAVDDPNVSMYAGKVADEANNKIKVTGAPVCDIAPNPFFNNGKPETASNHRGQSCGTPARITVNGASFNVDVNPPKTGTLEVAYYRGAAVQAMTCQWQAVKNEIANKGVLEVSPLCEAAGSLLEQSMPGASPTPVAFTNAAGQVDQNILSQQNISEIWKCDNTQMKFNSNGSAADLGQLKVAAQHHCAARADFEKAFAHIAACEIHSRALSAFEKALASDIRGNLEIVKTNVTQVCSNRCVSSCSYCASRWHGQEECFNNCATNCANDCYPGELRNFYAKIMSNWPNNGGCK